MLSDIPVQQQLEFDQAISQFDADIVAANSRFTSAESAAWTAYIQGLPSGQQSEPRTPDHPDMGPPAVALLQVPEPGSRLLGDAAFLRTNVTAILLSPNSQELLQTAGASGNLLLVRYQMLFNRAVHKVRFIQKMEIRTQNLIAYADRVQELTIVLNNPIADAILGPLQDSIRAGVTKIETEILVLRQSLTADVLYMSVIYQQLVDMQYPNLRGRVPGFVWQFRDYVDLDNWVYCFGWKQGYSICR